MADKINDGGPAFPQPDLSAQGIGPNDRGMEGMTLRDYFAGQALAGMAMSIDREYIRFLADGISGGHPTAKAAYQVADAMLLARSGRSP